ncbi:MAG: hypothetical protein LBL66_01725 [Clostridiales bacterium]|jgi:hypothetical protein|nr:hypothetical protein [Clostridiales bacterium]
MNEPPILTAILNLTHVIENLITTLPLPFRDIRPRNSPPRSTHGYPITWHLPPQIPKPAVYAGNLNRIEKNIKPHLPDKPLDGYGTGELQIFINRFEDTPNAQKKLAVLLGGAFQKALDTGSISFNPTKCYVRIPK